MPSHRIRSPLSAVLLLIAPAAYAGDPPLTLTLPRALELSRVRTPTVVEARTHVDAAIGRVDSDTGWFPSNPEVSVSFGPHLDQGVREGVSASVGLSQEVSLAGQGLARAAAARAGLDSARASLEQATREAERQAATAFLQALHAKERSALAGLELETADALQRVARRRMEAGEVSALDVNLTGIAQARARAAVADARVGEVHALAQLRRVLALKGTAPLTLEGSLTVLPTVDAREPRASPHLAALEASLEEARAQARLVRTDLPDVTLGLGWEREGSEDSIVGSLSVPIPVFQSLSGARTSAAAAIARADAALTTARLDRDLSLTAARERDTVLGGAAQELATTAMPLIDDTLQLSTRAYAAGELSLEALLVIRRDALETRIAVLDHQLDAALARIEHALLVGVLQ